ECAAGRGCRGDSVLMPSPSLSAPRKRSESESESGSESVSRGEPTRLMESLAVPSIGPLPTIRRVPESSAVRIAELRVAELRTKILGADPLYYTLGAPELRDAQSDALYTELKSLEDAHPELVTPDSPTQRVGAPLQKGGLVTAQHLAPMLSIESLTT